MGGYATHDTGKVAVACLDGDVLASGVDHGSPPGHRARTRRRVVVPAVAVHPPEALAGAGVDDVGDVGRGPRIRASGDLPCLVPRRRRAYVAAVTADSGMP